MLLTLGQNLHSNVCVVELFNIRHVIKVFAGNLFLTLATLVISKFDPVKCTSPCFACYFVSTRLVKISINADKIC